MYRVKISKAVYKFIKARPQKQQVAILEAFDRIAADPFDTTIDVKKMRNKLNHYRLRICKYRILFEIMKEEILIYFYKSDSRGDIYK